MEIHIVFFRDGKQGTMDARQVAVFVKAGKDRMVTHFQSANIARQSSRSFGHLVWMEAANQVNRRLKF